MSAVIIYCSFYPYILLLFLVPGCTPRISWFLSFFFLFFLFILQEYKYDVPFKVRPLYNNIVSVLWYRARRLTLQWKYKNYKSNFPWTGKRLTNCRYFDILHSKFILIKLPFILYVHYVIWLYEILEFSNINITLFHNLLQVWCFVFFFHFRSMDEIMMF